MHAGKYAVPPTRVYVNRNDTMAVKKKIRDFLFIKSRKKVLCTFQELVASMPDSVVIAAPASSNLMLPL